MVDLCARAPVQALGEDGPHGRDQHDLISSMLSRLRRAADAARDGQRRAPERLGPQRNQPREKKTSRRESFHEDGVRRIRGRRVVEGGP